MKKLEQLIQEFDRNQIKKVSILIVEMFYGGYQLKDGYEKPEDDKITERINNDNCNEFEIQFGYHQGNNKPFFSAYFYSGIEQQLDVNWFFKLMKEFVDLEEDFEEATIGDFMEYLEGEGIIQITSEEGLLGEVEAIGLNNPFLVTSRNLMAGKIKNEFESDIEFAVSNEVQDLDYEFFIE
jgi:hypothetical protein